MNPLRDSGMRSAIAEVVRAAIAGGMRKCDVVDELRNAIWRLRHEERPDEFHLLVRVAPSGCHEWIGGLTAQGYGRYREKYAHRTSYERANGPIPPGMFVCHKCDNRICVNPEHLWLGTPTENHRDMCAKGRLVSPRGQKNYHTKLTEEQVVQIRCMQGLKTQRELANEYGVTQGAISNIHLRKGWKHVRSESEASRTSNLP